MNRHVPPSTQKQPVGAEPSVSRRPGRAAGMVHAIALVGRDLTVLLPTGMEVFDVPPDCSILLHGEPIKLRMVQPRDHVWITFTTRAERYVAEQLVVQPENLTSFA